MLALPFAAARERVKLAKCVLSRQQEYWVSLWNDGIDALNFTFYEDYV